MYQPPKTNTLKQHTFKVLMHLLDINLNVSVCLIVKGCLPAAYLAHQAEMICVILRFLVVYLLCSSGVEGE